MGSDSGRWPGDALLFLLALVAALLVGVQDQMLIALVDEDQACIVERRAGDADDDAAR